MENIVSISAIIIEIMIRSRILNIPIIHIFIRITIKSSKPLVQHIIRSRNDLFNYIGERGYNGLYPMIYSSGATVEKVLNFDSVDSILQESEAWGDIPFVASRNTSH